MSESVKHMFKKFFEPKSVAFVGASNTPGKWGFTIMYHIFQGGYKGKIYPVNPKRDEIFNLKCYHKLADINEIPDLAVLVVPAKVLFSAMQDVIDKGIKAVVVVTSGFAEAGIKGEELQNKLLAMTRAAGVRFVGPNSMGIYTGYPDRLSSIMSSVVPTPGPVAILAQSGNLGVSLSGRLLRRGIGISRIVSVGNMADLTMSDYLEMLEDDDKSEIIVIYMEGASDGRRFLETAKRVCKKKPVVLLKGAIGEYGQHAAKSHTAALSGSFDVFKAAVEEVGIILANSMDDAVNTIAAFNTFPLPKGNRIGVLTLGGGWGVLCSDACDKYKMEMTKLPQNIIDDLDEFLPDYWSQANPIDTVASTTSITHTPQILSLLLNSDAYDSVIYLGVGYMSYQGNTYKNNDGGLDPQLAQVGDLIIAAEKQQVDLLLEHKNKMTKPLLMAADLTVRDAKFDGNVIPYLEKNGFIVYNAPWQAVRAISMMLKRREYLLRIEKEENFKPIRFDQEKIDEAKKVIKIAKTEKRSSLSEHESKSLLAAVGIDFPEEYEAKNIEEVCEYGVKIGYPLVLKISSPDIIHKSDEGGVILNVQSIEQLREQGTKLLKKGKVLVQKMADKSAVELLIGIKQDVTFGSVVVFGKGGTETNIWNDSASQVAPVTESMAERMIDKTISSKLIEEFRGRKALDRKALVDIIVRVSNLPKLFEEIAELDINPLFLYEKGGLAVDAAVILKEA